VTSPTDLTHNPKQHPGLISHFATIYFPDRDRQPDTQTDTRDKRQFYSKSACALLNWQWATC